MSRMYSTNPWRRWLRVMLAAAVTPAFLAWQPARANDYDVDVDVHVDRPKALKGKLVDIYLTDHSIQMPPVLEEGKKLFRITNGGTVYHTLYAQGKKRTYALAAAIPPGATVLVEFKVKEGFYTVWDPIADNANRGMAVTLNVIDD